MPQAQRRPLLAFTLGALLVSAACSAGGSSSGSGSSGNSSGQTSSSSGEGGGLVLTSGVGGSGAGSFTGDPKTCQEAADSKSYIGCDFWPTIAPNSVWSVFDYAVVVANAGDQVVNAEVTRGGQVVASAQVQPDSLATLYLPWIPELKGPDFDSFTSVVPMTGSVKMANAAYHLTTDFPVTVYQFSALEYAPQGGPPGKNWASCPADGLFIQCFSYSNDASLLLPSTAMTSNYRVTGVPGWQAANMGSYAVVTGIQDGTTVNVNTSATGQIVAGTGITATAASSSTSFTLDRGEVAVLLGNGGSDLSGSLIASNNPVQVLSGIQCINQPIDAPACDHVEESVFPAETLGTHYIVPQPTGPGGGPVGHTVRLFGNFDGTNLTYTGTPPVGAPATLNAGQVVDLGTVNGDFEVQGDQAFGLMSILLGGSVVDASSPQMSQRGDPAESFPTAVEQYRDKYVFLAPTDYDVNYVDIVMPMTATVTLDGAPIAAAPTAVGGSGFGVARVPLADTNGGAHVLEASAPVGIQVAGYGLYTSYYYPGGLNLKSIAPPPIK